MRRRPVLVVWVVAVVLATLLPVLPAGADSARRRLPPNDPEEIAAIFDPLLEPLGFVTTRAALQATDDYRSDPDGRHLAVYVEPIGPYTDAQFVDSFTTTARVYLPKVFRRWKLLRSFDVCQEPAPGENDAEVPPPLTQLFVDRRTSKQIDWADATLADILDVVLAGDDDLSNAYFDNRLKDEPAFVAATLTPETGTYER